MGINKMKSLMSVERAMSLKQARKVYCVDNEPGGAGPEKPGSGADTRRLTAQRLLLLVWLGAGLVPLLLQARSYVQFASSHKITLDLVAPADATKETADLYSICPVEGLVIAGAWWNVAVTHYFEVEHGVLCHFVVPQYNIHGAYLLSPTHVTALSTAPESCASDSFAFKHYFYHGSIGYYAFYEEAEGSFCSLDKTAYVRVEGLGTYDSNGANLANDRGGTGYRRSFWYGIVGFTWIIYRTFMLRRSYISCKRYGRRCDRMHEPLRFADAVVYVQESARLSAHGARNYHRAAILYLLVEGLMSDLFMLIAQDGLIANVQYISLGYNLSGVLSMLFEMVESMHWMSERVRCLVKRLLFNYETTLMGELVCSAAMQSYLTGLNHSSLKYSRPSAEAVSYYLWSLVGHGVIVLGIVAAITSIRGLGGMLYVRWTYGSLALYTMACSVDKTLGVRSKMMLLGGYTLEHGKLYYKVSSLKSFGLLKMVEPNGDEFLIMHKLYWFSIPRDDLIVAGKVTDQMVQPCTERSCKGVISMFDRYLGGPLVVQSGAVVSVAERDIEAS